MFIFNDQNFRNIDYKVCLERLHLLILDCVDRKYLKLNSAVNNLLSDTSMNQHWFQVLNHIQLLSVGATERWLTFSRINEANDLKQSQSPYSSAQIRNRQEIYGAKANIPSLPDSPKPPSIPVFNIPKGVSPQGKIVHNAKYKEALEKYKKDLKSFNDNRLDFLKKNINNTNFWDCGTWVLNYANWEIVEEVIPPKWTPSLKRKFATWMQENLDINKIPPLFDDTDDNEDAVGTLVDQCNTFRSRIVTICKSGNTAIITQKTLLHLLSHYYAIDWFIRLQIIVGICCHGKKIADKEFVFEESTEHYFVIPNSSTDNISCFFYQAIFSPDYGKTKKYKDIWYDNNEIEIQPALGAGKVNFGIDSPVRQIQWFDKYVQDGFQNKLINCDPLIRVFSIPVRQFHNLLVCALTEKQISYIKSLDNLSIFNDPLNSFPHLQERLSRYYPKRLEQLKKQLLKGCIIEVCDRRFHNQFGLWTETKSGELTEFFKEFNKKASNLHSYGLSLHKYNIKDGKFLNISILKNSCGITQTPYPGKMDGKYKKPPLILPDLDFSMVQMKGKLDVSRDPEELKNIAKLLDYIFEPLIRNKTNSKEEIYSLPVHKLFVLFLRHNNLSPEKFNKIKNNKDFYNTLGENTKNWEKEVNFCNIVYSNVNKEIIASTVKFFLKPESTLNVNVNTLSQWTGGGNEIIEKWLADFGKKKSKEIFINNEIISYCDNYKSSAEEIINIFNIFIRESVTKGFRSQIKRDRGSKNFAYKPFEEYPFIVGASNREDTELMNRLIRKTSVKDEGQHYVNLSDEILWNLHLAEYPLRGGVSATTNDIIRKLVDPINFNRFIINENLYVDNMDIYFKRLFIIICAFMVRHKYHTLMECYLGARQFTGNWDFLKLEETVSIGSKLEQKLSIPEYFYSKFKLLIRSVGFKDSLAPLKRSQSMSG